MAAVNARDIAAEIRRRLPGVGVKKLHKLLYYCQGHHLGMVGEPLFRESLSAWDMGPVVGQLWKEEQDAEKDPASFPRAADLSEGQLNTIGYVLHRYGRLSPDDLERLTHSEPPWQEADRERAPGTSARIPTGSLKAFFESPDARHEESGAPLPLDAQSVRDWLRGAPDRFSDSVSVDSVDAIRVRLAR